MPMLAFIDPRADPKVFATKARAGRWHVADGYGFQCFDVPSGTRSPTLKFKLHGSVNWSQSDELDLQPGVVRKPLFFPGGPTDDHKVFENERSDASDGYRLIIPTYLKDISKNRLLLHMWRQAARVLEHATEVIVIGSQLNPADAPARLLFGLALGANRGLREIVVVTPPHDPDTPLTPDHWEDFAYDIGKQVRFVRTKFEEWLLSGANA